MSRFNSRCNDNMSSHRKYITYGKASRTPTFDQSLSAADEFTFHSNEGSRGDVQGGRGRGRANYTLPDSFLHPKPDPMLHSPNKPELPCRLNAFLKISRIGKPKFKAYSSLRHTSSPTKDIMAASRDPDILYDGPSSGQDGHATRISRAGRLCRKEDELIPDAITVPAPFVYDDESLQRHVAAEISNDQSRFHESQGGLDPKGAKSESGLQESSQDGDHQQNSRDQPLGKYRPNNQSSNTPQTIQRVVKDQNTIKSSIITVAKTVDPTWSQRREELTGSSQPRQTRNFRDCLQERTSQGYMPKSDSRTDLRPENAPCYKLAAINSDPLITPSRFTFGEKFTTPRQRELWNKLLNENMNQSSSTPPNSATIAIEYQDQKPTQQSRSRTDSSTSMKSEYKSPHKRRRLVDNLGDENSLYYTDDSSQVEADASFNLRSANSGTGQPLFQSDPVSIKAKAKVWQSNARLLSSHSQAVPLHQGGGPKVTYARQRSYLTDDDISHAGVFEMPLKNDLISGIRKRRRGTSDVTSRFLQQGGFVDDQNETESQGSTMRSIHELREAGGNARVFSEMEAMLDDIDEANAISPTQKRSRLLYLAIKLQEPSFCRLFIDQGLNQRLFDHFISANDILVEALFAAILLCLLATSTSTSKVSHVNDSSVKECLIGLLDKDQDLTSSIVSRSFNLSRAAQAEFNNLWVSLSLKSTVWRAGRPSILTPCVISLQCLEYLVRHARELGSVRAVLSQADIRSVVGILKPGPSSSVLQPRPRSTVEMRLSVSILESCTISNAIPCEETPWTGHTLDTTVELLPSLDNWLKEDIGSLRTLTLRLYLNLTNNNPTLCKAFTRPDVIGSMLNIIVSHFQRLSQTDILHKSEVLLDNLILSLGSMINLAEWSDTVRPLVLSLRSGDNCFLDTLIQLFTSKQKKAAEVRILPPFIPIFLTLSGFL